MLSPLLCHIPDPVLAATIANRYLEALQHALNDNAFSVAKKNRIFIATSSRTPGRISQSQKKC
jgi:hypothetical protein